MDKNSFELQDRLVFSERDNREKTERILRELDRILSGPEVKRFLSEEDLRQLEAGMTNLRQRVSDKLTLVIAGSFKRGKSSLINALLGENAVPTSISPETMTINKILYGSENAAEAVLKNGMRLKLYDDEITREKLEKIMENIPAPIEYLEIRRNHPLLENLTFIDTPGLGESENDFRQTIASIMTQSDIIVYVVSALSPLSADEQEFLNAVVMPQNFSKMFVVVNMADALDSMNDIERVEKEVARRALVFNHNASVFSISALDEFCRKRGTVGPNPELSEYLAQKYTLFENALLNDILMQRELIKAQRADSLGNILVQMLTNRLQNVAGMLDVDAEKLAESERQLLEKKANMDTLLEESKKNIRGRVEVKKKEARIWMGEFLDRIQIELKSARDGYADGKEIQKHIYFYLSDKFKEAFAACLNAHVEEMETLLRQEIEEAEGLSFGGEIAYNRVNIRLKDISWTNVDSMVFLGTTALSVAGVSIGGFVLDAVVGFAREHAISKSQKDMIEPLLKQYPQMCSQIYEQLERAYDDYSSEAVKRVEAYFQQNIDNAISTVNEAKKIKEEFEGHTAEMKKEIEKIISGLEHLNG